MKRISDDEILDAECSVVNEDVEYGSLIALRAVAQAQLEADIEELHMIVKAQARRYHQKKAEQREYYRKKLENMVEITPELADRLHCLWIQFTDDYNCGKFTRCINCSELIKDFLAKLKPIAGRDDAS